ncbi:piggyBac transposable element-derived protein 4-like [Melanaphis sacchari]|uniref:piggyBac transposable element-derived protein 4-like n=1 Tax=Melanaphis sacchari TaxID=742174 RepID=UPI000DC13091|nr:piggyBac transposable element-derived protein 4-like [Melanaphis sacchari]
MKWHDKRDVIIISSEFVDAMNEYRARSGKVSEKPESILKYNEFMGGVDRSNQLISYYPCERKTLRWYAKIALHVIMNNAFILYKQQPGKCNIRLIDFKDSVINKLIYKHRPKIVTPT